MIRFSKCWFMDKLNWIGGIFILFFAQIDKLQSTFRQWENSPGDSGEHMHLTKELLASCESIKWQVHQIIEFL